MKKFVNSVNIIIVITQQNHNNVVMVTSNFIGCRTHDTAKRWDKKEKIFRHNTTRSNPINMGGVDKTNFLVQLKKN